MNKIEINKALIEKFLGWKFYNIQKSIWDDKLQITFTIDNEPRVIIAFTELLDNIFTWIIEPCLPRGPEIVIRQSASLEWYSAIGDRHSFPGPTPALSLCNALLEWEGEPLDDRDKRLDWDTGSEEKA